jgi:threonine/homoserine/homoserine lactone efflux protein
MTPVSVSADVLVEGLTEGPREPNASRMDTSFIAFVALAVVVIVTPGQDTALTIRNTLFGGRAAGVATAVGVGCGQLAWTVAASAGVTALLVASEPVFTAVRLAGAIYLVYLGASTLWGAWRGVDTHADVARPPVQGPSRSTRRAFRQGLLSNLGNPKMVIFFSSLLPQFAPATGPTFLVMTGLGLAFCSMTVGWLSAYAWLIAKVGGVFQRAGIRRLLDTVTGVILTALGLRLATEPVLVDR